MRTATRRTAVAIAGLVGLSGLLCAQNRRIVPPANTGQSRRLALLIGNNAYPSTPLRNSVADAEAMQTALREVGFATTLATDVDLPTLDRRIDEFSAQLRPGDTALFYYSGHGIQLEQENYLVPVSFRARDAVDAKYQSYSATQALQKIEASGAQLTILVLDACRDNPFRAVRGSGGGWAAMSAGEGSYIALATAPGRTASDNPAGANGLFTMYLLEALRRPGLSLDQVFVEVRAGVSRASQRQQVPWTVSSVVGEFFFRPGSNLASLRVDEEAFRVIRDSQDEQLLQQFLAEYPNSGFAPVVRLKLGSLRTSATPSSAPAEPPVRPAAPSSPLFTQGVEAFAANRYSDAVRLFSQSIQQDSSDAEAFRYRGISYRFMNQYQLALDDYDQALRIDPNNQYARKNRENVIALMGGGARQPAAPSATGIPTSSPASARSASDSAAAVSLGIERYSANTFALAILNFSDAIALDPSNFEAYRWRGMAHRMVRKYKEALADYNQALKLQPGYAAIYANRSKVYEDLGMKAEASADWKRSLR